LNVYSFSNEIKHSETNSYILLNDISVQIDTPLSSLIDGGLNHLAGQCEKIINSLNFQYSPELLTAYILSGKYFIIKYEYDNALKCFETAEKIIDAADSSLVYLYGVIYRYMGTIYHYKTQYDRAIKYYERATDLAKEHEILGEYMGIIYGNFADVYYKLKEYNKSVKYSIKYLQLSEKNIKDNIECYINLGICYNAIRQIEKAEYYIQLAEENVLRYFGSEYNRLLSIYSIKSYIYRNTGNNDKRLYYLNKAIEIAELNYPFRHYNTSLVLKNLGRYYSEIKDYKRALYTYQKAIIAITREFNDTNIYSNPVLNDAILKAYLLVVLKVKAYSFYYYYDQITNDIRDLKASLECYELAVRLHEKINAGFITEKSKMDFMERQRRNLDNTIEVALDVYEFTKDTSYAEKALAYAEKSKSSVLLAHLNDKKDKYFAGIPDSLIIKEKKLRNEIAKLNFRIDSKKTTEFISSSEYSVLKSQLFKLHRNEEEMTAYYENNFPEYYNLKYNITGTSLEKIQSLLDENQAILEYTITWKELYTFVITIDNFSVYMQDIDSTFLRNIMKMRELVSENNFGNYDINDFKNFVKTSYALYKSLIYPVAELIKEKNLIIVPDETLNLIPFEALITNGSVSSDYANFGALPYLFRQYPISYSYSASLLINQRKSRYTGAKLAAFLPAYTGKYYNNHLLDDSLINELKNLPPLFGAEEEVGYISKFYNSKIYGEEKAIENSFKKSAMQYNILHLAMHTIIDDKNPMYSKMIFTPRQDDTEDGLLHTFELYDLKLKANLIVLSSCNTGFGKMQKGEGLLSMARGFIYAGCPGLVLTQWTVADKAGAALMKNFYYYLSKGYQKDECLQYSKIDYLNTVDPVKTHPYYWAGYITLGDSSPLPSGKDNALYLMILILVSAITFGYFILKRRLS
jgi:CHAT domain-containing protein